MIEKDALAQAYLLLQQGQTEAAHTLLQPLAQSPRADAKVLQLAAAAATARGLYSEAIRLLRRALAAVPGELAMSYQLGRALVAAGQHQEALTVYLQLIAAGVEHADVYTAAAVLLQQFQRDEEALQTLQRALQLAPQAANNWYMQGVLQARLRRLPDAVSSLQQAIALAPQPARFHLDLALALHGLHRNQEALAAIEQARARDADDVEIWSLRGVILSRLGRYQEAIASCEAALVRQADHADASVNLALTLLTLGQLERAWPLYEARWRGELSEPARHSAITRWDGHADLRGKTILLWSEQGYGDTLQFCRYALQVADLRARVVLEVPPELKQLLQTLADPARILVLNHGENLPSVDYQLPLMSLPLALDTRGENIPAYPAYLHSHASQRAHWSSMLGPRQGMRIGIVCSGNAGNRKDGTRSIPLAAFAPLFEMVAADFYLLQPELRQADHAVLQSLPSLHWPGRQLRAFDDTAALLDNLDLVLSVDTAVAHLAGAMGVPVWILLSDVVDWRWFLGAADSPWYPSARLWRQRRSGDWTELLARVQQNLLAQAT